MKLLLLPLAVSVSESIHRGPIQVVNVTPGAVDWWTIFATVTSIITLVYLIYDKSIVRAKLYGKIFSLSQSPELEYSTRIDGENHIYKGSGFFFKLAITCTGKEFNFSDVTARVIKDSITYDAIIYNARKTLLKFVSGEVYEVRMPQDKILQFNNTCLLNKVNIFYLSVIVPDHVMENPDTLLLTFVSPAGKKVVVPCRSIDRLQMQFDEETHIPYHGNLPASAQDYYQTL